ncbi:hypothetical protein [Emticicia oligotrophica]|uniref:hypothetical protein n=1 Tax=Emticicia oligotrophica TaxID=312279 RepID=UPI00273AA417|nr:hypothetical protein [Emticicia oligotrophica]
MKVFSIKNIIFINILLLLFLYIILKFTGYIQNFITFNEDKLERLPMIIVPFLGALGTINTLLIRDMLKNPAKISLRIQTFQNTIEINCNIYNKTEEVIKFNFANLQGYIIEVSHETLNQYLIKPNERHTIKLSCTLNPKLSQKYSMFGYKLLKIRISKIDSNTIFTENFFVKTFNSVA